MSRRAGNSAQTVLRARLARLYRGAALAAQPPPALAAPQARDRFELRALTALAAGIALAAALALWWAR